MRPVSRIRRGVAMPVALGILVLVGLLVGLLFEQVRINNHLALKNYRDAQKSLLVASGLAHSVKIIAGLNDSSPIAYEARVVLDSLGTAYRLKLEPWGALIRLTIVPIVMGDSVKLQSFEVGSYLSSDSLPTIGISGGGGVSLETAASVLGAIWTRSVVKNAQGGAPRGTTVRPDRDQAMRRMFLPLGLESEWLARVDDALKRQKPIDSGLSFSKDSGAAKRLGGVVASVQIFSDSLAIRGLVGENLLLVARRISFSGTNRCKNCLVQSTQDVSIEGKLHWDGQILARDSIVCNMEDSVTGSPIAIVQGRVNIEGNKKKQGMMKLKHGVFTGWWGTSSEIGYATERMTKIEMGKSVVLLGVLSSGALIVPKGKIEGSILVSGVARIDSRGVLWEGGLDSVKTSSFSPKERILFPWLPGMPPTMIRKVLRW